MLRRTLALLFILVLGAAVARPAPAQPALGLIDAPKLIWGVSATFPPFESIEAGQPVGFDVDLVAAMTATLKLQSAPLPMEFKGLIPALLGGRIDAIVSAMYINPQRSQVVDFIPYLRVGNQLLAAHGNPLKLGGLADLCGHRIAVPVGTVYEKSADALAKTCQSTGKPALTILPLTSTAVSALALKEGRADAIIAATPVAAALRHDSPGAFTPAGGTFDNNTHLGMGLSKQRPALKAAIAAALKTAVADGTYAGLIRKYGLPPSSSIF
jgi:polar amino acid transport system substrate-binding protein